MNALRLSEAIRITYELYIPKESKYFCIMDGAVALRTLHAENEHLRKMVVYYQDIRLVGMHSEEYEEGFWDAVEFVKKEQEK
jgi:hypothetical protein